MTLTLNMKSEEQQAVTSNCPDCHSLSLRLTPHSTHQQRLGGGQPLPVLVSRLHHQLEGGPGLPEEAGGGDDLPGVFVDLEPVGAVTISLDKAVSYLAVDTSVSIRHLE